MSTPLQESPLSRIVAALSQAAAGDPLQAKQLFVKFIAWSIVLSVLLLHWADMAAAIWTPERFAMAVVGIVLPLVGLRFLGQGRLRAAGGLVIFGMFPWIAWTNIAAGGVAAPGTSAYIVLIVLAGWIFGWRAMLMVLALSLAWLVALASLESMHLLPDPLPFPPHRRALTHALVFAIVALMSYLIVREAEARVAALASARMAVEQKMLALTANELILRESQRLFESTFRASPVPMTIYTAAEMRYIDCNDAFLANLGLQRAEVIGRTGWELGIWPDTEARRRIHETLRRSGTLRNAEIQILARSGATQTHLICAEVIDVNGVSCVMSQGFDITERKRAEEALRASEARFEAAFHDSPAPLMIVNAEDGRYHDVNRAWLELTRRERAQVVGRTSLEMNLWVDPAARAELAAAVLRDGSIDRYETRLRRGDGEERACQISSRSFEHKGLRLRLASIWDVTDQRQAQTQMEQMNSILERMVAQRTKELSGANADLYRALQTLRSAQDQLLQSEKMAALGRLVAGVAHELNTPIGNGLLVATSLSDKTERFAAEISAGLRRSALEDFLAQSREAADMLTRSLHRAADLVASFKQVAADQTSSQRRPFQLDEVVNEVLLTHRPTLRKTPIEVRADVPSGIHMDSYPGPLGQVLANLIQNAIVHGHEGRTRGEVAIHVRRLGEDAVELTVRDDGHGIADDDMSKVFDPFFTTKLGRGGTGLGLPICHNLVTQTLGGEIRIESNLGAGTAVIVVLPLNAPGPDARDAADLHQRAA